MPATRGQGRGSSARSRAPRCWRAPRPRFAPRPPHRRHSRRAPRRCDRRRSAGRAPTSRSSGCRRARRASARGRACRRRRRRSPAGRVRRRDAPCGRSVHGRGGSGRWRRWMHRPARASGGRTATRRRGWGSRVRCSGAGRTGERAWKRAWCEAVPAELGCSDNEGRGIGDAADAPRGNIDQVSKFDTAGSTARRGSPVGVDPSPRLAQPVADAAHDGPRDQRAQCGEQPRRP